MDKHYNKYTYFWNGEFSQWYIAPFFIDGKDFNCAEQYMMYKKAMLFNDEVTAIKILDTPLPREQKAFGREVRNFDPNIWGSVARDVVYRANVAKFTANMELFTMLMDTEHTLLVEASPYDTVWGIGLSEADAIRLGPEHWRGTNWLGKCLTDVRDSFLRVIDLCERRNPMELLPNESLCND